MPRFRYEVRYGYGRTTFNIPFSSTESRELGFISVTQYYLTVTGGNNMSYGTASPTGDNWYDAGTSTNVSSN